MLALYLSIRKSHTEAIMRVLQTVTYTAVLHDSGKKSGAQKRTKISHDANVGAAAVGSQSVSQSISQ